MGEVELRLHFLEARGLVHGPSNRRHGWPRMGGCGRPKAGGRA